jgi:hypothetical protein
MGLWGHNSINNGYHAFGCSTPRHKEVFMTRLLTLHVLAAAVLALGCSDDDATADTTGQDHGITDVNLIDVVYPEDVTVDLPDVAPEAAGDVETDILQDVQADPATDSTADVQPDTLPGDASEVQVIPEITPGPFPPRGLPFTFTRPAEGEAVTPADVTAFTKKVTGLWKKIGYARWLLRTSTGVDATTGKDDYLAWHNDIQAEKAGDTVTFRHMGGEHNMWIPGSKVLSEVIGGYLLTGDWEFAKLTEQYCKGLSAVIKGFRWGDNDPAPFLMARAIFPMDHSFTLDAATWKDDGRKKNVKFSDMYQVQDGWNAHTFAWPNNPTWGSLWITNMRSKDDVRAIVRTTTFLPYVLEDAKDEWVKSACQETYDLMKAFNKDIVDNGYNIRTKDKEGNAYIIPCDDQDLGSYMCYTDLDPTNECCQRYTADLIGYGERKTEECGNGTGSVYDAFASAAHFYNIPIIWDYHMAAVGNALVYRRARLAYTLLEGLQQRIDSYMHPAADMPGPEDSAWNKELAVLLVQTASVGLPLTWLEARHVQSHWTQAVADFENWPNWDLWAQTVSDGVVQARPPASAGGIDIEGLATFLEYCNSPFKNSDGVAFVDCEIVKDMTKWGE